MAPAVSCQPDPAAIVTAFLSALWPPCKCLLVAVSGGSDSVALMHLAIVVRERAGIDKIGIAHVNHGLRGKASDRDEEFVRQQAATLGCQFHTKRLQGKSKESPGIEEWARIERYRFFTALRAEHGYDCVATGHTADDQAETVLLNLFRGSGLNGLTGIKPVREDRVIRPLLTLRRNQLRGWLESHRLSAWCEDASNSDVAFRRNRVRREVLPVLCGVWPDAVDRLSALAAVARDASQALDPQFESWCQSHLSAIANGFVFAKTALPQEPEIKGEYLARLFRRHKIPCERVHVTGVVALVNRSHGSLPLPDGWSAYPDHERIYVLRRKSGAEAPRFTVGIAPGSSITCPDTGAVLSCALRGTIPAPQEFDRANKVAFLDAGVCGSSLVYRTIQPDDRFQSLGSERECDLITYLKKQKVPQFRRSTMGVLATPSGAVLWIPGVAVSAQARISAATRRVLCLSIDK